MIKLVQSNQFENFISFTILLSSLSLSLENPLHDPNGGWEVTLFNLDIFVTVLFVFELIFKMIAFGFLFNGPKSYLLDGWHKLDFFIIMMSFLSLFPIPIKLQYIKMLRICRFFRPLRLILRNQNLKTSIKALQVGIPAILSLGFIIFLVIYLFAIVSLNLFKGKSFYCDTREIIGHS
jgi:hypothetical protein